MSDFIKLSPKQIRENNAKVRKNATAEQLDIISQVDAAFETEVRNLDHQFDAEWKLRAQAEALLGVQLDMSEIEELNELIRETVTGTYFKFVPKRSNWQDAPFLYKSHAGTVDRVDRYIHTLEKALIDLATKRDVVMVPISRAHEDAFTQWSFLDLIKLAFTRLFNRSK